MPNGFSLRCCARSIPTELFGQPSDVARVVLATVDRVSTQPSRVFAFRQATVQLLSCTVSPLSLDDEWLLAQKGGISIRLARFVYVYMQMSAAWLLGR